MERKRIKKYTDGGVTLPDNFTAGKGFTGTAAGQGIGMFGGMLGSAITQADQADGHMSTGGALGGGALKGAAMGAALGPIGMLGGAAIGALGGLMQRDKFNEEQRRKEEAEKEAERARNAAEEQLKLQQMDAALDAHPVKGASVPRFNLGGPTGPTGEVKTLGHVMVPRYAEGAGADAMASFDFYMDGVPTTAQQYMATLPPGQNINTHAEYWTKQFKPTYNQETGQWANIGQGYMAERANSMLANMQQSEYMLGGSTIPQYEAEGGEMIQYQQGDMPKVYGAGGITEVSSQEYEIKGPSHKQGGVDMSDEKGARIYSNKLTVDKALMEKLSKL